MDYQYNKRVQSFNEARLLLEESIAESKEGLDASEEELFKFETERGIGFVDLRNNSQGQIEALKRQEGRLESLARELSENKSEIELNKAGLLVPIDGNHPALTGQGFNDARRVASQAHGSVHVSTTLVHL